MSDLRVPTKDELAAAHRAHIADLEGRLAASDKNKTQWMQAAGTGANRILELREQLAASERRVTELTEQAARRMQCQTCGRAFMEGARIQVVSDEYSLHYVCAEGCKELEAR